MSPGLRAALGRGPCPFSRGAQGSVPLAAVQGSHGAAPAAEQCPCGCAEQGQPGRSSPLQGKQPFLERRHLQSTGLSAVCYPWMSTKHGPAAACATSLGNAAISALATAPKNRVDLFLFFQLWLIIKRDPCTKLGSVVMRPVTPNTGRWEHTKGVVEAFFTLKGQREAGDSFV